jgi:hypothetical protein
VVNFSVIEVVNFSMDKHNRWVNTSDNSYDEPVESVTYNCLYQLKHVEGEGWLVDTVDTTVVDGAAN